jgi:hypothetical protein
LNLLDIPTQHIRDTDRLFGHPAMAGTAFDDQGHILIETFAQLENRIPEARIGDFSGHLAPAA